MAFDTAEYVGPLYGCLKRVTGKRLRQRFLDDVHRVALCSPLKNTVSIVIKKAEH